MAYTNRRQLRIISPSMEGLKTAFKPSGPLLRRRGNGLRSALESIAFQSSNEKFGPNLEAQITSIVEKIKNKKYDRDDLIPDSAEGKEIVKLVFDRIGLKIDLTTDEYLAAILPFYANKNHIFLKSRFQEDVSIRDQNKLLNRSDRQKGTVNVEKVKLSGIFSEYENKVYMNFREMALTFDLTPPQMTGVLLHELGHGFDSCSYSDRLDSANQVIADVFRMATGNEDKRDMDYMYRELKTINKDTTEKEVEDLVNGNKIVAGYAWFKVIAGTISSQQSEATYDKTAFEAGADKFANRFGYGRELLSGLDKLYAKSWVPTSRGAIAFYYLITTLMFIMNIAAIVVAFPSFGSIYLGVLIAMSIYANRSDVRDFTYDDLKIRYTRIRNDMIEFLKRVKGKDEEVKKIIAAIKLADDIISKTGENRTIYNDIAWIIFPQSRKADRLVKEQQTLEKLMQNDLFLKSAELRVAHSV